VNVVRGVGSTLSILNDKWSSNVFDFLRAFLIGGMYGLDPEVIQSGWGTYLKDAFCKSSLHHKWRLCEATETASFIDHEAEAWYIYMEIKFYNISHTKLGYYGT
jgi:hypothetical protein